MTDFVYQRCRPYLRSLILKMTLNGSGIRDSSRVLAISINTVLKEIGRAAENCSTCAFSKNDRMQDAVINLYVHRRNLCQYKL
ncbi:MAG: IS1-like element transposase [Pyrinomonadaceae bacterium]